MSSLPPGEPSMLTGQPKNIEELRSEILQAINEKLATLESYDFRELPVFKQTNQLGIHPNVNDFFDDTKILSVITQFKILAQGLLTRFLIFIESCPDYDTLVSYESGLVSTSIDFEKWKTVEDAEKAAQEGEKTTLQHSQDLALAITNITANGVSASQLILDLSGMPGSESLIQKLLLRSSEGFPGTADDEYLKNMYYEFVKFLSEINSPIESDRALRIIGEYIFAAKVLSDQVTDDLVRDVFSNVFNILGNYFSAILIGSMYAKNP